MVIPQATDSIAELSRVNIATNIAIACGLATIRAIPGFRFILIWVIISGYIQL